MISVITDHRQAKFAQNLKSITGSVFKSENSDFSLRHGSPSLRHT